MKELFIRAIIILPPLVGTALLIKHQLIEPYGVSVLEFDVRFEIDRTLKGDKRI